MKDIIQKGNELLDYLIAIRRDIHKTPELAMNEYITRDKIKKYLDEIGIDYLEFDHHRGLMAYIYSENAKVTIGIRADIDALPIEEKNETSYKSQNPGIMHACGHDAHTAMLIGACRLLYDMREDLNVNIKFFFEAAEEKNGGAKYFVEDGLMENPKVNYMFGAHVQGYLEIGKIESKYGVLNASSNSIKIKIMGRRAHGAYPQYGIDALIASAQVITSLQSIVSRNLAPEDMAVLTLGSIYGGESGNTICQNVEINGTIRALSHDKKEFIIKRIKQIVQNIAMAYKCEAELIIDENEYKPVLNDVELVDIIKLNAKSFLGEDSFIFKEFSSMGSEDFSDFTNDCRGAFFHIGCKNEKKGITSLIHTDKFDIDERCLSIGAIMHTLNVLKFN